MKILIVEDALNIRNSLKKFISEIDGVSVSGEAEDSGSAINLINETNPDVILLDVELKKSNGFDVLKHAKNKDALSKPVVIMFSNHTSMYKEKALAAEADYFFDKTTELDNLFSTIVRMKK